EKCHKLASGLFLHPCCSGFLSHVLTVCSGHELLRDPAASPGTTPVFGAESQCPAGLSGTYYVVSAGTFLPVGSAAGCVPFLTLFRLLLRFLLLHPPLFLQWNTVLRNSSCLHHLASLVIPSLPVYIRYAQSSPLCLSSFLVV
ncbi:unnamed protein product, partial [Staurois parvus]